MSQKYFHIVLLIWGVVLVEGTKVPVDFKFGTATASYQVEGGWNASGKKCFSFFRRLLSHW